MNTLTNELQPNERALLYTAMLFFKRQNEQCLSTAILSDQDKILKDFHKYTDTQTKQLINKLFGDCFPEDLEFLSYFNQYIKDLPTPAAPPHALA